MYKISCFFIFQLQVPVMNYAALQYLNLLQGGAGIDPHNLQLLMASLPPPHMRPDHMALNFPRPPANQPSMASPQQPAGRQNAGPNPGSKAEDKTRPVLPPSEGTGNQAEVLTAQVVCEISRTVYSNFNYLLTLGGLITFRS